MSAPSTPQDPTAYGVSHGDRMRAGLPASTVRDLERFDLAVWHAQQSQYWTTRSKVPGAHTKPGRCRMLAAHHRRRVVDLAIRAENELSIANFYGRTQ